jgi:multidrug efflux pump subunit AcrA (membrane-fusion protein)
MRRTPPDESTAIGSDSFLDVVTNIVGILIILVMVVGMRAKNAPPETADDPHTAQSIDPQLESIASEAADVQRDIHRLHRQAESIEYELALQEAGRNQLALIVGMAEKQLDERKSTLDSAKRQRLEEQSQVALARAELEAIQQQIKQADAIRQPAVEIKAYATPISKTVFGKELHFQLSGGRVAYVPIEELFELAREETRRHMTRVADLTDRVMTVGPKQGFEMSYTVDITIHERQGQMTIGSKEWQVIPVQQRLGESIEEALGGDSNFRRMLSRGSPKDATITIWTYPDSFNEYRALNEELHRLGYATAGRPLPKGFPIGGSPRGSKSAAQ